MVYCFLILTHLHIQTKIKIDNIFLFTSKNVFLHFMLQSFICRYSREYKAAKKKISRIRIKNIKISVDLKTQTSLKQTCYIKRNQYRSHQQYQFFITVQQQAQLWFRWKVLVPMASCCPRVLRSRIAVCSPSTGSRRQLSLTRLEKCHFIATVVAGAYVPLELCAWVPWHC